MGYQIHTKSTKKVRRYRVWSSFTDTYISDEMSEVELRDFELLRAIYNVLEERLIFISKDIAEAEQVKKWWKENECQKIPLSPKKLKQIRQNTRRFFEAEFKVRMKILSNGTRIITAKIIPARQRKKADKN